ncbi:MULTISPECIES: hydroxyisourate hydrolase [unclassified Agarivorans]|uniref:hydroxyisourate hydrolase n=1 Tax=unclassified Agarivorans TaxID=2636026 RepID=UPI0026E14681|nr:MULTISPECIES: hydroxyisourate hydrolase [unclassified Agarivorans]MDO6687075.1 hydroxyisourate hydrolase [Agarivorans sp. 3_MG-2023]MDO6713513.1 hydroxyisourate hydrolase [Agarivorans sp. 2_MG-2023]
MSTLSCHVLDTSCGQPAAGIPVEIFRFGETQSLAKGVTNQDGRFSFAELQLDADCYCLRFITEDYCNEHFKQCFFPLADVVFNSEESQAHYHIPLLLSGFSYSTYRGS